MKNTAAWRIVLFPLALLLVALSLYFCNPKADEPLSVGLVEAEFIDIASSLPGRIDSLPVKVGQTVKKGQLLAQVHDHEVQRLSRQAAAMADAFRAQLTLLQTGARPQVIQAQKEIVGITDDQYQLFRNTYDRFQRLYQEGVVSGQERDLIQFRHQAAEKEREIARLNLEMLKQGSRPEAIAAANSLLRQAEEAAALTEDIQGKSRITAPENGHIHSVMIREGELTAIGYPIMSLMREGSLHLQFAVRQDQIKGLQTGQHFQVRVPGAEPEQFRVKLVELAPGLDFANWVPVKDKGNIEMRSFNLKFEPAETVKGLRPGMTAALLKADKP